MPRYGFGWQPLCADIDDYAAPLPDEFWIGPIVQDTGLKDDILRNNTTKTGNRNTAFCHRQLLADSSLSPWRFSAIWCATPRSKRPALSRRRFS